jgi:hypothetical protein
VRDPEVIEVLRPRFERSPVRNSQREVVETDCAFVESVADGIRVRHEANGAKAWVQHIR